MCAIKTAGTKAKNGTIIIDIDAGLIFLTLLSRNTNVKPAIIAGIT